MKDGIARVNPIEATEHPRRARLGLIEGDATSRRETSKDSIRGARASASLKGGQRMAALGTGGTHPRRARLGLIEGNYPKTTRASNRMHPRRARLGLIEGANLSN